ncbi:hypothetical protein L195_g058388, partial [Trifolium pratense]
MIIIQRICYCSAVLLCEAANRLGFGKDLVDDSRNLMAELEKMEITEQER